MMTLDLDTSILINNLKLRFNAYYTIVLHFTFLPIRKLPATTAEITEDFRQLPTSNDIPGYALVLIREYSVT
jgi:hypothetical protein